MKLRSNSWWFTFDPYPASCSNPIVLDFKGFGDGVGFEGDPTLGEILSAGIKVDLDVCKHIVGQMRFHAGHMRVTCANDAKGSYCGEQCRTRGLIEVNMTLSAIHGYARVFFSRSHWNGYLGSTTAPERCGDSVRLLQVCFLADQAGQRAVVR